MSTAAPSSGWAWPRWYPPAGRKEGIMNNKTLPWTVVERDEGLWWIYTVNADGTPEMQGPYPSFELAEGDARANCIASWQKPASGTALLCDPCWEAGTGLVAECQYECSRDLAHCGECGHRYAPEGQAWCDRCGAVNRLTREDIANLEF
jgi:hypothetical protein